MDAEKDTVTALGNIGTTVHIPDEDWLLWRSLYASFISLEPISRKSSN